MKHPFQQGGCYHHRRNTDLEVEVRVVMFERPDATRLFVKYWRRDFGWGRVLLNCPLDVVWVQASEYENWERVE